MSSPVLPVRRNALALFSLGLMILVTSSFLLSAWSSTHGRVEDRGSAEVFLIDPFLWVGSTFVFWGLISAGANRWLGGALWVANLVGLFLLEFLYDGPGGAPYGGTPFPLSLSEVVALAALLLLLRSRWGVLLKGLLLGLGSAALVLVAYGFGRQEIPLTLKGPAQPGAPPDPGISAVLWIGSVLAVFLLARFWSRPTPGLPVPGSSSPEAQPAAAGLGQRRSFNWRIEAGAVLGLLLLSAGLTGVGLADAGPLGGVLGSLPAPVARVGGVKSSPTGWGQFTLVLSADRTSINQYEVTLNSGPCARGPGPISLQGADIGR